MTCSFLILLRRREMKTVTAMRTTTKTARVAPIAILAEDERSGDELVAMIVSESFVFLLSSTLMKTLEFLRVGKEY